MIRVNVQLLEMRHARFQQLDVRKADRCIVREGHPEQPVRLRLAKRLVAGGLVRNRIGDIPDEHLDCCQLYRRQQPEITRSCAGDSVRRLHHVPFASQRY